MNISAVILCVAIALPAVATATARAQSASHDTAQVLAASKARSDSGPPWFTKRELMVAGVAVLATVAVAPLDKPVSGELQDAHWQGDEPLHSASQVLAFAGGPGPFFLGAGFFAAGQLGRSPMLADAGAHITESVVLAAVVTGLGKGIAGRALPGVKTSEEFQWGRGFHSGNGPFVSFPSGHTAAAFAMASALTEEAAAWHPGIEHYVGPVAYATASAIGLARLYQHVHWMSDLPLAAAIGTWSGLSVESHVNRRQHGSPVWHIVQATTVQRTTNGGTLVGWSMPFVAQSLWR